MTCVISAGSGVAWGGGAWGPSQERGEGRRSRDPPSSFSTTASQQHHRDQRKLHTGELAPSVGTRRAVTGLGTAPGGLVAQSSKSGRENTSDTQDASAGGGAGGSSSPERPCCRRRRRSFQSPSCPRGACAPV